MKRFIIKCCICIISIIVLFINFIQPITFAKDALSINQDTSSSSIQDIKSYCLRDDYLIYAQHQSVQGLCWNFGALSSLSSTLMKKTNEYLDFSESWISCCYANNSTYAPGAGGWGNIVTTYGKKDGLVLEQDFPYEESFFMTSENVSVYYDMYKDYANTHFFDNVYPVYYNCSTYKKERKRGIHYVENRVKSHILNHGAVTASLNWKDYFITTSRGKEISVKIPDEVSGGHLVTLIGWDDDIIITYNKKIYQGAWIALNSYSNENIKNNHEGVVYIVYDDNSFYSSFEGYIYRVNNSDNDVYLNNYIEESNSLVYNSYKSNHATFNEEKTLTKQKNIFYNTSDVYLKYKYDISCNTSISDIRIYKDNVDLTSEFSICHDNINNSIAIASSNLKRGSYKIVTTYTNSLVTDSIVNAFYILDGLEINYIDFEFNNDCGDVINNGFYMHFNNFNYIDDVLNYGTSISKGTLTFKIIFATYHDVNSINIDNNIIKYEKNNSIICSINYDLDVKSTYDIVITSNQGFSRVLTLNILKKPNSTNKFAYMLYTLNGGYNNPYNLSRMYVDSNNTSYVKEPFRDGYFFVGWYTSKDFFEDSKLIKKNDLYYIDYSTLIDFDIDTVGWQGRYDLGFKDSIILALFAKWEKKIEYSVNYVYDEHVKFYIDKKDKYYEQDKIEIKIKPKSGYYISNIIINDRSLSIDEINNIINSGYTIDSLDSDLDIIVQSSRLTKDDVKLNIGMINPFNKSTSFSLSTSNINSSIDDISWQIYEMELINGKYVTNGNFVNVSLNENGVMCKTDAKKALLRCVINDDLILEYELDFSVCYFDYYVNGIILFIITLLCSMYFGIYMYKTKKSYLK